MKIIVNPHKIEIVKSPVNEREIDITKCEFEFAEEITNGYVKEAYFTLEDESYKQIIVNNECEIPSEVLVKKGQVEIGVVAFLVENEQEIKRYNPSPAYFETWDGSLKDAENTEPITPSEMEQYEQALQDGLNELEQAVEQAENLNITSERVADGVEISTTDKMGETTVTKVNDGDKGDKGDPGDDYVITPADYNAIATIVKNDIVIPSKTSDLTNDSGFITNTVNNLANYYLKAQTYTKEEVNNLIGQISTVRLEKVNVLPQTGENGVIYLVPNSSEEQNNIFDEYIWIDNDWELIGATEIDLTGYATETWVTSQISDFLTASEIATAISTALSNYYTKTQVDSALSNKADSSVLTNYVQKTDKATTSGDLGIVGVSTAGITVNNNGILMTLPASSSEITAKTNRYKPIVPATIDSAVKEGITSNANTLTSAEKKAAQSWLGVSEDINAITTNLEADKIYRGSISTNTTFTLPTITDNTVLHAIELQVTISNYDNISIDLGATNYFGDIPELGNGNFIIYYEYDGTDWCVGSLSVVGD